MTFRVRLTLVLATVAAGVALLTGLAAVQVARVQIYAEIDRSLLQVARVADQLSTEPDASRPRPPGQGPGGPGGLPGQGLRLPGLLRVEQEVGVQVHQPDGEVRLLLGAAPVPVADDVLQAATGDPVLFTTRSDGTPFRAVARPLGGDRVGVVFADASRQAQVLTALAVRFVGIGLLVSAGAALVGWFVAGRLVGPLTRLTSAAEHVSRTGDLSVDVRTDDPDEAGRLSRAFNEMLAALGASQAAQQRLVDDAGHELRTPITSILSNAEVLKRYPDMDAATREQIADDVIAESQELTRLVNALVDLAGVAGTTEDPARVDLADLVTGAVRRLPASDRDRVRVTGGGEAVVRPVQVQRAVANLLTNAAKFDPSGGPIEVTVGAGPQGASIEVRDHGPGFGADDLPHVFARFYRSDAARATPGSGLGLAIVKDVAQQGGGGVTAANHPEGGAVVRMTLPPTA